MKTILFLVGFFVKEDFDFLDWYFGFIGKREVGFVLGEREGSSCYV